MTDFRHLGTLILVLRRGIERERERIARAKIRIAEYRADLAELGVDPDTGEPMPNAALSGRTRSDEAAGYAGMEDHT